MNLAVLAEFSGAMDNGVIMTNRAGMVALLILAFCVAPELDGPRAQTADAPPAPGAPMVIENEPASGPAPPAIEYVPVPAAPVPASPTTVPVAPNSAAPAPLPPGSARDANRLDRPAETLKKAGEVVEDLSKGDIKALRRGPLLIHGNYCGIGNKPGLPPVDVLDAACMRHDGCTKTGAMPSCACDGRLFREASTIAADPSQTKELQVLAGAVATSMSLLICK